MLHICLRLTTWDLKIDHGSALWEEKIDSLSSTRNELPVFLYLGLGLFEISPHLYLHIYSCYLCKVSFSKPLFWDFMGGIFLSNIEDTSYQQMSFPCGSYNLPVASFAVSLGHRDFVVDWDWPVVCSCGGLHLLQKEAFFLMDIESYTHLHLFEPTFLECTQKSYGFRKMTVVASFLESGTSPYQSWRIV